MKVTPRRMLIGAFMLILISTSCNLPAQTPTPVGTILPTGIVPSTDVPISTVSNETPTTLIPVTGMEEVSIQCQFCVNNEPHAVLLLPESASFLVSEPVIGVNCITAQVVNDKRILFCRGTQQTSFTLNVCFDNSNCLQYPIVLETCPITTRTGITTPVVLTPANTGVSPTAPVDTSVPAPTQTVQAPPPAVATTSVPILPTVTLPPVQATTAAPPPATLTQPAAAVPTLHSPQAKATPLPGTRLPRTNLADPEGFIRWYFQSVWAERNYQELWDNYLTPAFKARPNAGGYEGYAAWWDSVQRVDVNSVTVLRNDGTNAWIRVNVTFTMVDGRVISNQEYDYDLFFDATRQTWMFDYRTPPPTPQ